MWRQIPCPVEIRENTLGEIRLADAAEDPLEEYIGQAQCVYIDPPFFTGEAFVMRQRIGEAGWKNGSPAVSLTAYSDVYESREAYLAFLRALIRKAHALLRDTGAMFLHLDTRMDAYARLLLDEIFGEKNFVNQIIWAYQSGGRSVRRFSRKHDLIFFYQKSRRLAFDLSEVPIPRAGNRQNHMRRTVDGEGRACRTIRSGGKTYVYYDDDPVYPGDVWTDLSHLQQKDPQRTGYDTQKPQALMERILKPVTKEGDLAVDLCCGSGTFPLTAALLKRRFLGVDSGKPAVSVSRKRLIAAKVPFTLNACAPLIPAQLDAGLYGGIAFCDVVLRDFSAAAELPEEARGLDAVDQWSVGVLRDGQLYALDDSVRLKQSPALRSALQIPLISGTPAVSVTDVLGNRYCFVYES